MQQPTAFCFDHVAISVPDIEAAERFYAGALGLKTVNRKSWERGDKRMDAILGLEDTAGHKLLLTDGRFDLEIWQFTSPLGEEQHTRRPVSSQGITHFGFQVENIAAVCKRLVAAGMVLHTPPSLGPTGNLATYGRDPFGNVIELVQPPNWPAIRNGGPTRKEAASLTATGTLVCHNLPSAMTKEGEDNGS